MWLCGPLQATQKGDPAAILKRQLEEKEKLLATEQEDAAVAKSKLRELNKVGPGSGAGEGPGLQEVGLSCELRSWGSGPPRHRGAGLGQGRLVHGHSHHSSAGVFLPSSLLGRKPGSPGAGTPCLVTAVLSQQSAVCRCRLVSMPSSSEGQQVQGGGRDLRTPLALSPGPFIHKESEFLS